MATSSHHDQIITFEAYLDFCRTHPNEKYELINGQITMLAGGTLNHARIAFNIGLLLGSRLYDNCQTFNSDAIVKLPSGDCVLPNVTVTCDERDKESNQYIEFPSVIFEVLSPSTEAIDRKKKFALYSSCPTIKEYVLVNTDEPLVEVFHREKDPMWTYRVFHPDETVTLTSIDVELPVEDIYKNFVF